MGWNQALITTALVACMLGGAGAAAEATEAELDVPARRVIVFNPAPPDRAEWFFITEFSTSYVSLNTGDSYDNFIFTDSFGAMRNVGRHDALGASVDMHLAVGQIKPAATLRYKHWFDEKQSLELAAGYLPSETPGMAGPIVSLRYHPTPLVHFQMGAATYRDINQQYFYSYTYPYRTYDERTKVHFHAGMGFDGVLGIGFWGAQLVGTAVLASMLAGME